MSKKKLKIALVDDHPIVIEGLKSLFNNQSTYNEILSFTTAATFLSYIKQDEVDVVLLDILLPDSNGVEVCKKIKNIRPETVVIGLSNQAEQSTIVQLLENGASGFMLKSETANHIVNSIESALQGEIVMSNEVKKIVFASKKRKLPSLTTREKQLIQLLSQGKTTAVIAEELFLSPLTIDTYRKNLLQKFKVNNTTELVSLLFKEKLL